MIDVLGLGFLALFVFDLVRSILGGKKQDAPHSGMPFDIAMSLLLLSLFRFF
jgi:hypothetical protein